MLAHMLMQREKGGMDWAGAAELNRVALMRIVAQLFALARIAPGETPQGDLWMTTLPRYVWRAVMRILEPAEAAMRRLLIIAAHGYGLALKPLARRSGPAGMITPASAGTRPPCFNMFDPMKRFEDYWRPELEESRRPFPAQLPEPQRLAPVSAIGLWRRINALHGAARDLPKAALRYARWAARRAFALRRGLPQRRARQSLMRPGFAPGWRKKPLHEADQVLRECHSLANSVLSLPKRPWT